VSCYLQAAVLSEPPEKNVLNHSLVSMTARSTWSRERIEKTFHLERSCRLVPGAADAVVMCKARLLQRAWSRGRQIFRASYQFNIFFRRSLSLGLSSLGLFIC
jgi:hypothetical protein